MAKRVTIGHVCGWEATFEAAVLQWAESQADLAFDAHLDVCHIGESQWIG